MQARYLQEGETVDYTPVAAVSAGDVVVIGTAPYVANLDIAANVLGALAKCGLFAIVKDASVFSAGDRVYWDTAGNPTGGTAGTGAATSTPTAYLLGHVPPAGAALTGDATVQVELGASRRSGRVSTTTVAATGSTQTDAAQLGEGFTLVSAADATKGVKLPSAVAGMVVKIKNNVNAILKVWPSTGDGINAVAVNGAFSIAALTSVELVAYDATTWYSLPLLPS